MEVAVAVLVGVLVCVAVAVAVVVLVGVDVDVAVEVAVAVALGVGVFVGVAVAVLVAVFVAVAVGVRVGNPITKTGADAPPRSNRTVVSAASVLVMTPENSGSTYTRIPRFSTPGSPFKPAGTIKSLQTNVSLIRLGALPVTDEM